VIIGRWGREVHAARFDDPYAAEMATVNPHDLGRQIAFLGA